MTFSFQSYWCDSYNGYTDEKLLSLIAALTAKQDSVDRQAGKKKPTTDNINAHIIMLKPIWDGNFPLVYLGKEDGSHCEKVALATLKFNHQQDSSFPPTLLSKVRITWSTSLCSQQMLARTQKRTEVTTQLMYKISTLRSDLLMPGILPAQEQLHLSSFK